MVFFSYAQVIFFNPLSHQVGGTVNLKASQRLIFSAHETLIFHCGFCPVDYISSSTNTFCLGPSGLKLSLSLRSLQGGALLPGTGVILGITAVWGK